MTASLFGTVAELALKRNNSTLFLDDKTVEGRTSLIESVSPAFS